MKSKNILGVLFVIALIMTACAPVATESPTATLEPTSAPTEATTETATGSPVTTDTAVAETATLVVPDTGAVTISVSESTTHGPILVTGDGMALYVFMADTQDSGTSTCGDDDGCAPVWPPLLCSGSRTGPGNDNANANTNGNSNDNGNTNANTNDNTNTSGTPAADDCSPETLAGEGVDPLLLGTITRDDGSTQVTYNGWPLYIFLEDTAAGDTNGQGLDEFGGLWFLVSPTGEPIQS